MGENKIEIWKDIVGYEGKYKVSNNGNIKATSYNRMGKERILSGRITGGYSRIALYNNGKVANKYVHRLVAEHFIQNPNNYKEVNHIDGNKLNNHVDNLEWVSAKQNSTHAVMTKLRILPTYKVIQRNKNRLVIQEWNSISEICNQYGYESSMIYKCCENKLDSAYGYRWEYSTRDSESNIYVGGDYH